MSVDYTQTAPGVSAKRAQLFLKDSFLWIEAFRKTALIRAGIVQWIQQQQLFERGITADNEVIGFYSFATSLNDPRKQFNTHYTLFDTGDLYKSIFVKVLTDSLIIDASDLDKIRDQEWFSDRIIALGEEGIEERIIIPYQNIAIEYATRILLENL